MTTFKETEINQAMYEGASFREVRIQLQREPCGPSEDWFDHKKYIRETLPKLLSIKPPGQIRLKKDTKPLVSAQPQREQLNNPDADVVIIEEEQKRPRLVPEGTVRRQARNQKLDLNELKANKNYTKELLEIIPADISDRIQTQIANKVNGEQNGDLMMKSNKFDFFTKNLVRQQLYDALVKSKADPQFKSEFNQSWAFSELNKEQLFKRRSSLKLAQLNTQLNFIQSSNIQDYFYALIIDEDFNAMKPVLEYILHDLLVKQGFDEDFPQIFILPMSEEPDDLNIKEFGSALGQYKELKTEDILISAREKTQLNQQQGKFFTIEEINRVAKMIMSETGDGLMLYFGSQQKPSKGNLYNETSCQINLLQHILLALKTLQHKGNLVIKLCESFSNLTVSLMFILYRLFNTVLLGKPLASSPLTSTQYLVCQGFQKPSGDLLTRLESLYTLLNKHQMQDDALLHVTLIDPHILENEEKFRSYVQKVNDITATFRHQVISAELNREIISEETWKEANAGCYMRWGLQMPEELKETAERIYRQNAKDVIDIKPNNNTNGPQGIRQLGNASNWRQTGRPSNKDDMDMRPPEPKVSEETQLLQIRQGEQFMNSFLSNFGKKPGQSTTAQTGQQKKPQLTEQQKRELELKKRQQELQQLKERLKAETEMKNAPKTAKKKKPATTENGDEQHPTQPSAQPSGNGVQIDGDKIKISIGGNSTTQEGNSNDAIQPRKRDQKLADKNPSQDPSSTKITLGKLTHQPAKNSDQEEVKQPSNPLQKRHEPEDVSIADDKQPKKKRLLRNDDEQEVSKVQSLKDKIEEAKRREQEEAAKKLSNPLLLSALSKYVVKKD